MTGSGAEWARNPAQGGGAQRRAIGAALALGGGALLSLAGISLRHMEAAGGWQILFYRSLTFFVVVAAYLAIRYRARKPPLDRSFATLPPCGTDTFAGWVTVTGRPEAEGRTPNGD